MGLVEDLLETQSQKRWDKEKKMPAVADEDVVVITPKPSTCTVAKDAAGSPSRGEGNGSGSCRSFFLRITCQWGQQRPRKRIIPTKRALCLLILACFGLISVIREIILTFGGTLLEYMQFVEITNKQQNQNQIWKYVPLVFVGPTKTQAAERMEEEEGEIDSGNYDSATEGTWLSPLIIPAEWDVETFQQRRQTATSGLTHLSQSQAFLDESKIAIYNKATRTGLNFAKWDPCTLERIYQQKRDYNNANNTQQPTSDDTSRFLSQQQQRTIRPLKVVVLGGSCTARSPNNCQSHVYETNTSDVYGGRYTNILEAKWKQHDLKGHMPLEVINMGHGGVTSIDVSFFMDELIVPEETDVLVWEFAVNDSTGNEFRALQLWLHQVQQIFRASGKPTPPLVLVYLWDTLIK